MSESNENDEPRRDVIPEKHLGALYGLERDGYEPRPPDQLGFRLTYDRWFRASSESVAKGVGVGQARAKKLQDLFTDEVDELYQRDDDGEAIPDVGQLTRLALAALPMLGEAMRNYAAAKPELWRDRNADEDDSRPEWHWGVLLTSGFGAVYRSDDGSGKKDSHFALHNLQQLMGNSVGIAGIHPELGPFHKDPRKGEDFVWLTQNTEFDPSTHCAEMVVHVIPEQADITFSWSPVWVDNVEDWTGTDMYGPFEERTLALNVAHRTKGHIQLVLAARLNNDNEPELRLAALTIQSVEQHRNDEARTVKADPFQQRGDAPMWRGVSGDDEVDSGEADADRLRQAALMMRKLSEMLEKQADSAGNFRGEGWEDLEAGDGEQETGESVKRQDDPFEGLIINRKPVKA